MRVPIGIGDYLVLDAVRESKGTGLTVTDDEMVRGVQDLSSYQGIFAAPEGGAIIAALRKMLDDGQSGSIGEGVIDELGACVVDSDVGVEPE